MSLQQFTTTGIKGDWMAPITPIPQSSSSVRTRLICEDVDWGFTALQNASTPCSSLHPPRQIFPQLLYDSGYKSAEWHSVSELSETSATGHQTSSFLRPSASDSYLPRLELSEICPNSNSHRRDEKITRLPVKLMVEATVAKFSPKYGGYLIGRKIGEEQLDIISALNSNGCYTPLQLIFAQLEPSELVKVSQVSVTWRNAVVADPDSQRRLNQLKLMCRDNLESLQEENQLNVVSGQEKCHSRQLTSSKPLNLIQTLGCRLSHAANSLLNYPPATSPPRTAQKQNAASPSPRKGSKHNKIGDSSPPGPYDLFVSEASRLRESERLTKCPKCCGPAKVAPVTSVASCSRANCQYQFCSKCRGPPHGSQDCSLDFERFGSNSKETINVQRAKKNLRRLLR